MEKTRIAIAGSRGLIGSAATQFFEQKPDCEVFEIDLQLGHDLTDEDFVKSWFESNPAEYLINLFALNDHVEEIQSGQQTLFSVSLESVRKYLETNVVSLFSVCRQFARSDHAKGIINFSSTYGLVSPLPDLYSGREKHIGYSTSKGAVIQLTKHLATHLAPRIRVNCIAPGGVEHDQGESFIAAYSRHTPIGRMMRRTELNRLLEYLCSDHSSYMTGSVITIDGGWTAW